ncbi:hypothetical protein Tco_0511898 [Tanacetum coccineum]
MKNSAIELYDEDGNEFIVNKHRVKPYQKNVLDTNRDGDITLDDEGEGLESVSIRRIQGIGYDVLEFLGVGTTFDIFQNILFPYSLNTAYCLSWIRRIGLVSFVVFVHNQTPHEIRRKDDEKKRLVSVIKKHKEAFAWKTSDISAIIPSFCKHKINFEEDAKPIVQMQRRLNPNMKKVMKKEMIKLLDAGIIYAIEDSPWVSPVHCVPKKGGMTVVTNEKNKLVPTRTATGWRVCIDYRKLNEATRKDHFPLPFMHQMLERLPGNKFFCFLNGISGYF